jgi:hypothetical protein
MYFVLNEKNEQTWIRRRRIGNRANDWTAYRVNANTAKSLGNREASTTEADIAAFMERTEISLL